MKYAFLTSEARLCLHRWHTERWVKYTHTLIERTSYKRRIKLHQRGDGVEEPFGGRSAREWSSRNNMGNRSQRMHCLRNHPSMLLILGWLWKRNGCEFTTYLSVCIVESLTRVGAPFIRFITHTYSFLNFQPVHKNTRLLAGSFKHFIRYNFTSRFQIDQLIFAPVVFAYRGFCICRM